MTTAQSWLQPRQTGGRGRRSRPVRQENISVQPSRRETARELFAAIYREYLLANVAGTTPDGVAPLSFKQLRAETILALCHGNRQLMLAVLATRACSIDDIKTTRDRIAAEADQRRRQASW